VRKALLLICALALGGALAGCGAGGTRVRSPAAGAHHSRRSDPIPADPILARLGLPPLHGTSPLPGYLMIADRDNNRIIIVNPAKRIVWRFPRDGGAGLAGPDDAFISPDGRDISVNQEFNETIALISLTRHPRVVWSYGHAEASGSAPGYLAHPDDAYLLPNGLLQVADIINCRILWITPRRRIVRSIGSAGDCTHDPPRALSDPNGDTPIPGGGVLVTEIGGWADRFNEARRLVWSITTPTNYPSDAQLLPDGNLLVAAYNTPGRIDILTPRGRVVWTYERTSGPGALQQTSLAVMLPNGMIAATDDWNDRVVVINPATKRIVWQYGHDGVPGSGPGYLRKPDGLALVP
jgi:DNA-binding beta-propeller fold protein YncE